ncbi:class I SAM-dependent methyltransferase [bacterium]|nr:class I SAM-dependent methyltransferase [bacterium]
MKKDIRYVPSPSAVVEGMLDLAALTSRDTLYDLGCGDGRIVIGAAARGARAIGFDLDPGLIARCHENARLARCSHNVDFRVGNFFQVDLSEATVIALYLLTSVNRALRSRLVALRPGTRVVSHSFDMGDWPADCMVTVDCKQLYLWTIP